MPDLVNSSAATYFHLQQVMSGIWFFIGGLILLGISALQFSEVLVEWSMQKYAYTFHASHDNIAGRSYQNRLCLPEPIDIVYTWVNGSDPSLIKELIHVRSKMAKEMNATEKHSTDDESKLGGLKSDRKSVKKFKWKSDVECPFPNCVLFNAIALSLPKNVTKERLVLENRFLEQSNFYSFNNRIDPSVRILWFKDTINFQEMLTKGIRLNGKRLTFHQVFITSTVRNGVEKINDIRIINDIPVTFTETSIKRSLEDVRMPETDVKKISNLTILHFNDAEKANSYLGPLKNQIPINGQSFKVMPATFVWKPMTSLELGEDLHNEDIASSRFADNDELKYSLRSVDKYAPWIRKIFIVTNGQIPSWLNLDHPRIKIITHEELFLNKSHLPTYSSPAIEAHIHRIPGLSKKFIYMNDDVFFGDYIWPDDFYTHAKGQKVYLTWPVPNCNEGCPAAWVNDKYCDKPCNVSECDWDGGDCANTKGKPGWTFGKNTISNIPHSALAEYCNSGCANSWIGDRYCDINCNVRACGYDAGDCGLAKLRELPSFILDSSSNSIAVPVGIQAFYINLTYWLQSGTLTDGEYAEADVLRTAVFSKKFKLMTITLYSNLSATVSFKFKGYRDANQTLSISHNVNITVNTLTSAMPTAATTVNAKSTAVPTAPVLRPFSLYKKETRRIERAKSQINASNINMELISLYEKKGNRLPLDVIQQLNKTEEDLKAGDITLHGYNKRKLKILSKYYEESQRSNATGSKLVDHEDHKGNSYRISRHLTSVGDEEATLRDEKKIRKVKNILENVADKISSKYAKRKLAMKEWSHFGYSFQSSPLPWERNNFFLDVIMARDRIARRQEYLAATKPNRMLLDTFASSLLHVSRIYNRAFSYKARKVPAHIPHMVDIDIISEMQDRFWPHFQETSSHKVRSPNDMQFAFSYFYYLMGVPATMNMSQLFVELDTDSSGVLSDRELRTLAAKLFPLPLESSNVQAMSNMLENCSLASNESSPKRSANTLPTVNKELLTQCDPIIKLLTDDSKKKLKYQFEEMNDEDVTFKMIRNNVSHVVFQLDWIRKNRRKFVCLNDNIDHANPQAKIIRAVLKDFFESMFPRKSQFELPETYRNRFLRVEELNKWMAEVEQRETLQRVVLCIGIVVVILIIFRKKFYRIFRYSLQAFRRRTNRSMSSKIDIIKI
eukprot:gene20317-22316_t